MYCSTRRLCWFHCSRLSFRISLMATFRWTLYQTIWSNCFSRFPHGPHFRWTNHPRRHNLNWKMKRKQKFTMFVNLEQAGKFLVLTRILIRCNCCIRMSARSWRANLLSLRTDPCRGHDMYGNCRALYWMERIVLSLVRFSSGIRPLRALMNWLKAQPTLMCLVRPIYCRMNLMQVDCWLCQCQV